MCTAVRTLRLYFFLFAAFALAIAASSARLEAADVADSQLLTVAEKSDFRATASHRDVLQLAERLAARSHRVLLRDLGTSHEGRSIPLLLVADPPVVRSEDVRAQGKLVALLFGAIHGGEVCGKEALLILARELAFADKPALLEHLVLAIVPVLNPDGADRIAKGNRPGQVGPDDGTGVRANAQGLDLNRDWVKLEAPETRAVVRFLDEWDPAITIDTHTTNGSRHRYALTFEGPKHPAGDPRVIAFTRDAFLPEVREVLRRDRGIETFFYGNFAAGKARWETYPALPRFGTPYRGLRNRIDILSEACAYAPFRERVASTLAFVKVCLERAAARRAEIAALHAAADADTIAAGKRAGPRDSVALRCAAAARAEEAVILGYDDGNGGTDGPSASRPHDYAVEHIDDFRAVESVRRAFAYLVPAESARAVDKLREHGIDLEVLREDVVLDVETYSVERVERAAEPFEGHRLVSLEVAVRREEARIAAGTVVVRSAQRVGALAAYLLEPRAEDGLAAWGFFDEGLRAGAAFPVRRVAEPIPLLTAPLAKAPPPSGAVKKLLTYERVYESSKAPDLHGSPVSGLQWLPDGVHFLQVKEGKLLKVEARTGLSAPFYDPEALAAALARIPALGAEAARALASRTRFHFSPDASGALFEHEFDLYFARVDGSEARRLTSTPAREELESFSPDGGWVAFVRDHDLFAVDVATATERALTAGGSETLRHGKADWVYFEEVFDRDWKAYWWSPDSRRIAFLRTDSSQVPEFTIVDDAALARTGQAIERARYPKPGDPNPRVDVGVVSVAGGPPAWIDLSEYDPADTLVTGVGFRSVRAGGAEVWLFVQNRIQTWLDVCTAPAHGGRPLRLLRDTTRAWVPIPEPPRFLADGSFLLTSARSGWRHLYHFEPEGSLRRALTQGEWDVRRVHEVDEEGGWVYLSASKDSPIAEHLYRVSIAEANAGEIARLTPRDGNHSVNVAPRGRLFAATSSQRDRPAQVELRAADGSLVRTLDQNPVKDLEANLVVIHEYVEIAARDGFRLPAAILRPPRFDPSRRYPVWLMTYAGPEAPTVRDSWSSGAGSLWDQVLASAGVVVFRVDPRSATARGAVSAWSAYRQLGVQELRDLEDAVAWLRQHPWVDGARVGISGYSYGGFMTAYAMTHSDLFTAGFAGAPVTDWRGYDSIYTERYMSTPADNSDGYEKTSVVRAAAQLRGNLLLVHGTTDDNVHIQNTLRLTKALQDAGKQFRLMVYPGSRHAIFSGHLRRLQFEFILENLRPARAEQVETIGPALGF